jgi:CP family cyanate transporter-like MFS transporter
VDDAPVGAPVAVDRPTPDVRSARPGRQAVHVLAALLLLTLTLRTAVTGLSPLLPRVSEGIPLTPAQAGVVGALPPFCFAAAGLLGPPLLRRNAAERVVLLVAALQIVGLVLRPWSGGPWLFMAASVVALIGMGLGNFVLPVLVKAWFPHRIPMVTSMYVMGVTAGTSLPALLAVPVADAVQRSTGSERLGWQVGLSWWASLSLLVIVAWTGPARRPRATPASRPLVSSRDSEPAETTRGHQRTAERGLWRSRTAWGIMLLFGANSLTSYAMFAWLPTRLVEAGMAPATAGLMLAVFGGMGVPAALVVPHLAARTGKIGLLATQFAACFAIGELGLLLAPLHLTLLWVVLAGWGSGGFSLALTLIGLKSRTPAGAARLSGFAQGLGYLMAGFGPIIAGVLRQETGGWMAPFAVLIGVLVLMIVGGVLANPRGTVEDELARARR